MRTLFDELCSTGDEQKRERLIRELAKHPEETLGEAMRVLNSTAKPRWEIATRVIRAIGYPHNEPAIPLLISHVGNKNSLAWNEAVKTLEDMGTHVVVPYLLRDFWERDHIQYWGEHIEGICEMLCAVDRAYALQCGPALAYLLGRDNLPPEDDLDRGFLLDVLEKIGPDCAEYAMPVLIDFLRKQGKSATGLQAWRLIRSFEPELVERYTYLLTPLQESFS